MDYYLHTIPEEVEKFEAFLYQLQNRIEPFVFQTSGSTGKPKQYEFSYEQLCISAMQTIKAFDLQKDKSIFLPLSMDYVAAKMMVVRAFLLNAKLVIVKASSRPFLSIEKQNFQLASFVPLQIETIINDQEQLDKLNQIDQILIGGAALSNDIEKLVLKYYKGKAYHTYGMTETLTHVAIRPLGTAVYSALDAVEFRLDEENCLAVLSPINKQWLQTNDVVELVQKNAFVWKGRRDHIINSGGVKIHPEKIEQIIAETLHLNSIVFGVESKSLGHECQVLIEREEALDIKEKELILRQLSKYELPKKWHYCKKLSRLKNGKIDRKSSLACIH